MTAGALSHQIRGLEEFIGVDLLANDGTCQPDTSPVFFKILRA
jgi:hypothetical protein